MKFIKLELKNTFPDFTTIKAKQIFSNLTFAYNETFRRQNPISLIKDKILIRKLINKLFILFF